MQQDNKINDDVSAGKPWTARPVCLAIALLCASAGPAPVAMAAETVLAAPTIEEKLVAKLAAELERVEVNAAKAENAVRTIDLSAGGLEFNLERVDNELPRAISTAGASRAKAFATLEASAAIQAKIAESAFLERFINGVPVDKYELDVEALAALVADRPLGSTLLANEVKQVSDAALDAHRVIYWTRALTSTRERSAVAGPAAVASRVAADAVAMRLLASTLSSLQTERAKAKNPLQASAAAASLEALNSGAAPLIDAALRAAAAAEVLRRNSAHAPAAAALRVAKEKDDAAQEQLKLKSTDAGLQAAAKASAAALSDAKKYELPLATALRVAGKALAVISEPRHPQTLADAAAQAVAAAPDTLARVTVAVDKRRAQAKGIVDSKLQPEFDTAKKKWEAAVTIEAAARAAMAGPAAADSAALARHAVAAAALAEASRVRDAAQAAVSAANRVRDTAAADLNAANTAKTGTNRELATRTAAASAAAREAALLQASMATAASKLAAASASGAANVGTLQIAFDAAKALWTAASVKEADTKAALAAPSAAYSAASTRQALAAAALAGASRVRDAAQAAVFAAQKVRDAAAADVNAANTARSATQRELSLPARAVNDAASAVKYLGAQMAKAAGTLAVATAAMNEARTGTPDDILYAGAGLADNMRHEMASSGASWREQANQPRTRLAGQSGEQVVVGLIGGAIDETGNTHRGSYSPDKFFVPASRLAMTRANPGLSGGFDVRSSNGYPAQKNINSGAYYDNGNPVADIVGNNVATSAQLIQSQIYNGDYRGYTTDASNVSRGIRELAKLNVNAEAPIVSVMNLQFTSIHDFDAHFQSGGAVQGALRAAVDSGALITVAGNGDSKPRYDFSYGTDPNNFGHYCRGGRIGWVDNCQLFEFGMGPSRWPAVYADQDWAKGQIIVVGYMGIFFQGPASDWDAPADNFGLPDTRQRYHLVVAPGERVDGPTRGTTPAQAIVSGQAALIKGVKPCLNAKQIADIIFASATRRGIGTATMPDPKWGWGVINIDKSIEQAAKATCD